MKKLVLLIVLLFSLILAACGNSSLTTGDVEQNDTTDLTNTQEPSDSGEETKQPETKKNDEEKTESEASPEEKPEKTKEQMKKEIEASKIKLNGSGKTATKPFKLQSGFVIVNANYNSGANFIVTLKDKNGNPVELIVNTIGSYKGKTFALIPQSGKYFFQVEASGKWNLTLSQHIPLKTKKAPVTLKGEGDSVVFVEMKSGLKRFNMKHTGQSNFIVMLNGSGLLANEIGNFSGSTAQQVKDNGVYAISVKSEGSWSIDIK